MNQYKEILKFIKDVKAGLQGAMSPSTQTSPLYSTMFRQALEEVEKENRSYRYLITFTLDPKKGDIKCNKYIAKVSAYVVKQLRRKPLGLSNVYFVQEGGDQDNKHIHWHASVTATKPLKKDRFDYYKKLYGNVDISHTKAQTQDEAINYMSKQSTPVLLTRETSFSLSI